MPLRLSEWSAAGIPPAVMLVALLVGVLLLGSAVVLIVVERRRRVAVDWRRVRFRRYFQP